MQSVPSKRYQQRPNLQEYRNRDCSAYHLDDSVFDILNKGIDCHLFVMTCGCIDALDRIPAGSTVAVSDGHYDQSMVDRGLTAEEMAAQDAIASEIIDSILASKE